MEGKAVRGTFKFDLEALSYHVNKGNFLSVRQSEHVFTKSLHALVPHNKDGQVESLKRVAWAWLKEIGKAVNEKNKSMLQQAYNEFMRLYCLIEVGGEMTVEDLIANEQATMFEDTNTEFGNQNAMFDDTKTEMRSVKKNDVAPIPYDLSLCQEFVNEDFLQKLDKDVANYMNQKEYKEVTPIKTNNNLFSVKPDNFYETLSEIVEKQLHSLLPKYVEGQLQQYDVAKIKGNGTPNKCIIPSEKKQNLPNHSPTVAKKPVFNPYNKSRDNSNVVVSMAKKNDHKKTTGNKKRNLDKYHNQMNGNVSTHDMDRRSKTRQSKKN